MYIGKTPGEDAKWQEGFVLGHIEMHEKLKQKKTAAEAMASYIVAQDIDEDVCKRVDCRITEEEETEEEIKDKCIKCVIDYFGTPCIYLENQRNLDATELCVKKGCKHFNTQIDSTKCYDCEYKLIPRKGNELEIEKAKEDIEETKREYRKEHSIEHSIWGKLFK